MICARMGLIAEITHENEKQMLNFGDIAASFNEVVCKNESGY
jgi:hypothetical protein